MPTQAEIARDWKTSRVYVHKCVRKGCPVDSYLSARVWRDTYARQRLPTHPKQLQRLHADEHCAEDNGNANNPPRTTMRLQKCLVRPLPSPNSLEFSLECARRAEQAAYILFQQALKERRESKICAALRNYNAAVDGRLKIEQWYRREIEYRRRLIPMKEVRLLMCKGINVIVSRLVTLPDKVGPVCNPEAPAHAIAVLLDECANLIADIKKSCPQEFIDAVLWPALS